MSLSQRQHDALRHLAENCRKAVELTDRLGAREQLEVNWEAQYALIRCLEIVGEAATRLGATFQAEYPAVPWSLMVAMRNRLAHGYDEVSVTILWQTATQSLPELLSQIEAILLDAQLGDLS